MLDKNMPEYLTYDDVLLKPARSAVQPKDVKISTKFTKK
jgi:IMP dehydrogenase/GMP reductase